MKLSIQPVELTARHALTIANHTIGNLFRNVVIKLEYDGQSGLGEAAPFMIYGENQHTVIAVLETLRPLIEQLDNPWEAERIMAALDNELGRNYSAKAAIDMALYDLQGKLCGQPVYRMLGLDAEDIPLSSFTIGIDTPEMLGKKICEAEGFPLLKIKVGGPQDMETLKIIREQAPEARLRVDANCGWEPRQALRVIEEMAEFGVEFVEQPLPPTNLEGARWLYERSPLPLMADESCERLEDIPGCAGRFDAINIKLAKCGGIRHALKMIGCARALGLEVMLGCMLETSISITAAAHISPLVDYADLDGAVLISNDPFTGMGFERCRIILPATPGLGIDINPRISKAESVAKTAGAT